MKSLVTLIAISWLIPTSVNAEEMNFRFNYLPVSKHHGDTNTTNEVHHGVGLSVSFSDNPIQIGLMRYKNSYNNMSTFGYVGGEFACTSVVVICAGGMVGYATGYEDDQQSPLLGGLTLRYKWVQILSVPSEVTALIITVPLEEIFKP